MKRKPLTSGQLRAAGRCLRWRAEDLAGKSAVGVATIRRAELTENETSMTAANDMAVRRALETAGVEFIDENRRRSRRTPAQAAREKSLAGRRNALARRHQSVALARLQAHPQLELRGVRLIGTGPAGHQGLGFSPPGQPPNRRLRCWMRGSRAGSRSCGTRAS